jgi:hypothetical protein
LRNGHQNPNSKQLWKRMSHQPTTLSTFSDSWHGSSWDKEVCKYKIAELTETSNDLDDYAEYVFVVRERIGTWHLCMPDRKPTNSMIRPDVQGGSAIHRHQVGRTTRHPTRRAARHQGR